MQDLRNVSVAAKAVLLNSGHPHRSLSLSLSLSLSDGSSVLLNSDIIAIDQDKLGKMGLRVSPKGETEVWAR